MKKSIWAMSVLLTSIGVSAAETKITEPDEIMDFLVKHREALDIASACTAATGSVCSVTTVSYGECRDLAGGPSMYIKLSLINGNGTVKGSQSLSVSCAKK